VTYFDQHAYDIRCEWGLHGAEALAPHCDAVIIVDVLSFTTAVSVAVSRGGIVFPYRWKDAGREAFAKSKGALLAGPHGSGSYSLSPVSLMALTNGQRIILPSPNGSTISLATGQTPTYAGCLRNAQAVARAAQQHGPRIGVVPCGERWPQDDTLRPAIEDLLGAGAIISALSGRKSPEAMMAEQAFHSAQATLWATIRDCSSGRELIEREHAEDVRLACELNADSVAPRLLDEAFQCDQDIIGFQT